MSTIFRSLLSLFIVALIVGAPWAYWNHREAANRNFRVVEEGVLYRSGQMTLQGFARAIHDHGIRTVVCLRDGDQPDDLAELNFCKRWGITHVRIPPRAWSGPHGVVPAELGLATFRRVLNDRANFPVLIHCFAGMHRTGAYCAVYRMDYNGWSNERAIEEMKQIGYETLDDDRDLQAFLESYRPTGVSVARPASRRKE